MKINLFAIVVLGLALSACNNRQTAQLTQNEPLNDSRELTEQQRKLIIDLYANYHYDSLTKIRPGIPEDFIPYESEDLYPWDSLLALPTATELKAWADKAVFNGYRKVFVIKGFYHIPSQREIEKISHSIYYQYLNENEDFTLISSPIQQLGGLRLKVTPFLTDWQGTPFYIESGIAPIHIYAQELLYGQRNMYFNIGFNVSAEKTPKECKGYIDVAFLRPSTAYRRVPIGKKFIGREYELDSVRFKLIVSQPGDVIMEYTGEWDPNWEIVTLKNGKPMGCDGEGYRELDSAKHKVLFSYQHPNCTFAEYMVQLKDFSMKEAGISPDMLRRDLADYRGVENKLPLTKADIEYLSTHEPPKPETDADGNEIRAFWYKTYMDAEAIHIFPSMYPENDESLIIYQTKIKLETQRNEDYYDEKEQR